ncbi:gamma-glutamyl-gamma-aminobutyrate hydrolase family protein [Fusobacterium sp. MFO224]|uniref:gamma-glutamyl-gamma-aminobutyrate hydrolase family protein n=1 Tax=Fusobacterium sp. MFO224 TaxID=3378070 RepID=UPI0038524798
MKKIKTLVATLIATIISVLCVGCMNTEVPLKDQPIKPKIGISWKKDYKNNEYAQGVLVYMEGVRKAGGIPVVLPKVENQAQAQFVLAGIDGIIMTGGEDVNPKLYGEKPNPKLEEVNNVRDTSDYWMIKEALRKDVPMLATCRGTQLLNVVCGGTLYQDLPTQYSSNIIHRDPSEKDRDFVYHNITVKPDSKLAGIMGVGTFKVNSWHHQAIKKLGKNLKIVATAPDGIVEAVEYQGKTFVEAVQFHPEWLLHDGDKSFLPFFTKLVEHSREKAARRAENK